MRKWFKTKTSPEELVDISTVINIYKRKIDKKTFRISLITNNNIILAFYYDSENVRDEDYQRMVDVLLGEEESLLKQI